MPLKMKVTLDQAAIAGLTSPGGIVDKAVGRAADHARDRAKENIKAAGRIDKAGLWQSIVSERLSSTPNRLTYQVGSPLPYAIYNERGTGIYGPHHSYIYPRKARVLRFKPSKNSAIVAGPDGYAYFSKVKGMEGIRFLERALYSLTVGDFT